MFLHGWIDFDIVIYQAVYSALNSPFKEFLNELDLAINHINETLEYFYDSIEVAQWHYVISGHNNFRKTLWPQYKIHRKEKPELLDTVMHFIKDNMPLEFEDTLEADDYIRIHNNSETDVVLSIDKDFKQIIGTHYDWNKDYWYEVTPNESKLYFLEQVMTGDSADGYKGIPKIGHKRAINYIRKWRQERLNYSEMWDEISKLYVAKGLTKDDALMNARMAFILDKEHWDSKEHKVILWQPEDLN